mmetsp:Transcript_5957/g.17386  ORF Transcript_5957/g.17386 Transcript_5957/m.17386 type:complete len:293 (+) Transcript_5957:727-1605(+)
MRAPHVVGLLALVADDEVPAVQADGAHVLVVRVGALVVADGSPRRLRFHLALAPRARPIVPRQWLAGGKRTADAPEVEGELTPLTEQGSVRIHGPGGTVALSVRVVQLDDLDADRAPCLALRGRRKHACHEERAGANHGEGWRASEGPQPLRAHAASGPLEGEGAGLEGAFEGKKQGGEGQPVLGRDDRCAPARSPRQVRGGRGRAAIVVNVSRLTRRALVLVRRLRGSRLVDDLGDDSVFLKGAVWQERDHREHERPRGVATPGCGRTRRLNGSLADGREGGVRVPVAAFR